MFSNLVNLLHCKDYSVSDRLNTVESSFYIEYSDLQYVLNLKDIIDAIPLRDIITVTLRSDSDEIITISNNNKLDYDIKSFIDIISKDENIVCNIQIDKSSTNNMFSIYDYDSFCDYLLQQSCTVIMKWFSDILRNKKYLVFEVFDSDVSFSTKTMAFESSRNLSYKPLIDRVHQLEQCKAHASFYNMDSYELLPDDFSVVGVSRSGSNLEKLFKKIETILSMVYSSSSASFDNDMIDLHINGQRTLNKRINVNEIIKSKKWIRIYNWIYTDGNIIDKMLIAHNVISLYCKYDNFLSEDFTMFDAIKTNYNLYLRSNLNQYLSMKRDISSFIQNTVSKTTDYSLSILGKFKNNLLALFGFVFTVVLSRIGNAQNWDNVFSRDSIFILEIVLLGSILYLILCFIETKYKLKKVAEGYNRLKENYIGTLSDLEIEEAFKKDELLKNVKKIANRSLWCWSILWLVLLVLSIIAIEAFSQKHGLIVWFWNKIFLKN